MNKIIELFEEVSIQKYFIFSNNSIIGYKGPSDVPFDVTIPLQIDGKNVLTIGDYAFFETNITSVRFELDANNNSNINTIGECAFYGCKNLNNINLPNSISIIGESAFANCSSLATINIPSNLKLLFDNFFWGCSNLTEFINNSPNYNVIDGVLFDKTNKILISYPCGKSNNYSIPESVTSIGESAFDNCKKLVSITLSNNIKNINDYAFNECIELTKINIPTSVINIGFSAFNGCIKIKEIDLPNTINNIGVSAFFECKNLTTINIPNSVTFIGHSAFGNCINLTNIIIPNDFYLLSFNPFWGCSKLTEFKTNNIKYNVIDGVLFDKDNKTLIAYPAGKSNDEYYVPDGVNIIGDSSFRSCKLKSIILPATITNIDANAFFKCEQLNNITFNGIMPNIDDDAFNDTFNITIYHYNWSKENENTIRGFMNNNVKIIKLTNDGVETFVKLDYSLLYLILILFGIIVYLMIKL